MGEKVKDIARKTKEASYFLSNVSSFYKDQFLLRLADNLERDEEEIKKENRRDLERAKDMGMKPSLLDRLELSSSRIKAMASGLREVANLPDPVGEVIEGSKRPNGLLITKMRVPLGVVAIIYEARPNVTIDSIGLGIKSGNALLLRGSSSAIYSNRVLVNKTKETLSQCGFPPEVVNLLECESHEEVQELLTLRNYIDVVIPRGGAGLIKSVVENSQVPVIETGVGNCHVYVDESADGEMAEKIVINAKTQRPSVCNACETLLVDEKIAPQFLPRMVRVLREKGVEIRGCEKTKELVKEVKLATEEDWYAEYLDLILAVKVVGGIDEAIKHINKYGSHHSEAIVTRDYAAARKFLEEVDAAAVYVNASTRFTDGGEFGMGAEIGISTQKLHARGPMGLRELTTVKYMVWGTGQIRE
ncbi:MAG TPA: glutamate-5-semialdehyde dehydrogenase [Candidatus Atribacteria bacterium]|nr:glutamate-5-semialdehyde dehydrogenase [Candidatus Atribacteria bacterium]